VDTLVCFDIHLNTSKGIKLQLKLTFTFEVNYKILKLLTFKQLTIVSISLANFGACLMVTAYKHKKVEGTYTQFPLKWSTK